MNQQQQQPAPEDENPIEEFFKALWTGLKFSAIVGLFLAGKGWFNVQNEVFRQHGFKDRKDGDK